MSESPPELTDAPRPHAPALPPWLRRLAEESWQAELLVSGLAIVGGFQLLGTAEVLAEWLLFNVRFAYLGYLVWVVLYLSIGLLVIPLIFLFHFALRAYWIGLIGLASVFPHGIGPLRPGTFVEGYAEELARDYPDLPTLIDRAERRCSLLFAVASLAIMVFLSIALGLAVVCALAIAVARLTDGAVPFEGVFWTVIGGVAVAYLVIALGFATPLRRVGWASALALRLSRYLRRATFTLFERPATVLQGILQTNVPTRRLVGPALVAYAVLFGGMAYVQTRPMVRVLQRYDRIAERAARENLYAPARYREAWPEGDFVAVDPYVERERVAAGEYLDVYLPELGETELRVDAIDGEFDRLTDMPDDAYRGFRQNRRLATYATYYRFRLGDTSLTPVAMQSARVPGQRYAVRATLVLPEGTRGMAPLYIDERARGSDTARFVPRAVIPLRIR